MIDFRQVFKNDDNFNWSKNVSKTDKSCIMVDAQGQLQSVTVAIRSIRNHKG